MFETLTDEQILLFSLALFGLIIFAVVALRIGRGPKNSGDQKTVRKKVEEFERSAHSTHDPDPPGDSPFIQLMARVDAIEKDLPSLRRDIESIRNFANLLEKPAEEKTS